MRVTTSGAFNRGLSLMQQLQVALEEAVHEIVVWSGVLNCSTVKICIQLWRYRVLKLTLKGGQVVGFEGLQGLVRNGVKVF